MSDLRVLGMGGPSLPPEEGPEREHLMVQRPLQRVLAFTGRSIDEVVNDPIAKREILGYYKLYKQVQRGCEVVDLERWWNPRW